MSENDPDTIKQRIAVRLKDIVGTATICGSAEMVRVKHLNELIEELESSVTAAPLTVSPPNLSYCLMAGSGPTCVPLSRPGCMRCRELSRRREAYQKEQQTCKGFDRF